MEKKMTAVQWLENELQSKLVRIVIENDHALIDSLFQQAIALEREQIEDAFNDGRANEHFDTIISSSNYYTRTYSEPLKDKI